MTGEQCKVAGVAWAEREAEAVIARGGGIDWERANSDWISTWREALPLVEGEEGEAREECARIINQAASIEWSRQVQLANEAMAAS